MAPMIGGLTHHPPEHRHQVVADRLAQSREQSLNFNSCDHAALVEAKRKPSRYNSHFCAIHVRLWYSADCAPV